MIKSSAIPRRCVVALLARLREAALHVVWICSPLEILEVTRHAGSDGDVVIVRDVTVDALAWRNRMGAGQRESGRRVIERCTGPRSRAVTLLTGLREASLYMVWVCSSLEVFQVAGNTSRSRQIEVVVDMAIDTLARWNCVRARQLKSGAGMIERRSRP